MNHSYNRTNLMILQWTLQEEDRRQKIMKMEKGLPAAKKIPAYQVSLYRRPAIL